MTSLALATELRSKVQGKVLIDGDGFELATQGWMKSGWPADESRRAALVVQPKGTADVQRTVEFARAKGLSFGVKGGGHSPRQPFIADGGIIIDLSMLKCITVDQQQRLVTVQGGVTMSDILRETEPFALAPSWGNCGQVGTGTPLSGGIGHLSRSVGLGADNIVEATLVLADGSLMTAQEGGSNADVLECVRGGGSTLGVVVSMTVRLHDVSDYHGIIFTASEQPDGSSIGAALEWTQQAMQLQPRVGISMWQQMAPDGKYVIGAWAGMQKGASQADLDAWLKPLQSLPDLIRAEIGSATFFDLVRDNTTSLDVPQALPYSSGYIVICHLTYKQATQQFTDLVRHCTSTGMPEGVIGSGTWDIVGSGVASNAICGTKSLTPYADDRIDLEMFIFYLWPPCQLSDERWAFGESVRQQLEPHVLYTQAYVNLASFVTGAAVCLPETLPSMLFQEDKLELQLGGASNVAKLRAMKQRLDPDNCFSHHPYVGLVPSRA